MISSSTGGQMALCCWRGTHLTNGSSGKVKKAKTIAGDMNASLCLRHNVTHFVK